MNTINLLGHHENAGSEKSKISSQNLHWTDPKKEDVVLPMEKGGVMAFVRGVFGGSKHHPRVVKEKHVQEPHKTSAGNMAKNDLDAWRKILDERRNEINGGKAPAVQTMPEHTSVLPKVGNAVNASVQKKSAETEQHNHKRTMPTIQAAWKTGTKETAGEVVTDENSLNVNLVRHGTGAESPHNIPQRKWGIIIAVACFVVAILSWGGLKIYHYTVVSDVKALETQISALSAELNAQEFTENEAVALAARVQATQDLMNNRIQWDNMLELLEQATLDDVYYTSIQGAESGGVALSAVARSVQAATEQALVLEKTPGVAGVKMSTLTNATETRIATDDTGAETTTDIAVTNFTLDLTLEKELLLP